jgi:uncharacterized protein (TIGR02246 family)
MGRGRFAVLVALPVVLTVSWVMAVRAQTENARAAIEAANQKFSAAFAKKDAAQLASMYSSNAMALPPNGDIARGREAIQQLWDGAIKSGVAELILTTAEVEAHGDTAHEVGTYLMRSPGGKQADHGKYIVVWKREQGQWKLHRDIWNTSTPAAGK